MKLIIIICNSYNFYRQAIFSSLIRSSIQMWCTRTKGPYFVTIFKPFGIPYASTFGCLLFADTFHYGRYLINLKKNKKKKNFHCLCRVNYFLEVELINWNIYGCSMMGAFICGVGYYTVLWGQIKDEDRTTHTRDHKTSNNSSGDDQKVPLLQEDDSQVWLVHQMRRRLISFVNKVFTS